MNPLRLTLRVIGVVQIGLGLAFVAAPTPFLAFQGLDTARPGWVDWLLVMTGARFLGYGVGMFAAARDPERHRLWIDTMIGIQALDWAATLLHVLGGDVTWRNVTTAAVLPPLFVVVLLLWRPRRSAAPEDAPLPS